ncbi:MAG TPA: ABC transporter permease [Bacillaceae bacterium]
MNKFWIVFSYTYWTKLKSKSFIITTAIMLGAIILGANLNQIIASFDTDKGPEKILVIDETGQLYEPVKEQFKNMEEKTVLVKVEEKEDKVLEKVEGSEEYPGYLILGLDESGLPEAVYKSKSVADFSTAGNIQAALQSVRGMMAASQLKLSPDQLQLLNSPAPFENIALSDKAKSEEELNQTRGLVYILLFVIYFTVIMYASMVGMEIATEKSSRIMEILISSTSPVQQMFAKILGVAMLGLTQLILMLGTGYFVIRSRLDSLQGGFFDFLGFEYTKTSTIVYAVIFFLLGYLLYATLAAFLGSLASRVEDAQQLMMPIQFLLMIAFFLAMAGLFNPERGFVALTSYIPFFTPMLMFVRIGMLDIPAWEAFLGIAVMLLAIIILGIIGGRIYKGGVLMYGKSNSFKDIKKALQLTKK